MTCAPTQDEFLKPLNVVNGSYAPCGAGGEEHSGGRPDVKRKFLLKFTLNSKTLMESQHSRNKQRTDQRVLVLIPKFLALKKLLFPL